LASAKSAGVELIEENGGGAGVRPKRARPRNMSAPVERVSMTDDDDAEISTP
jgi:hypothetical protein